MIAYYALIARNTTRDVRFSPTPGSSRLNRNQMFLLSFEIHYVRDVGVAGSNPVTPTIDFIRVFQPSAADGSGPAKFAVPETVPVSASKNRSMIRLFLDVGKITL